MFSSSKKLSPILLIAILFVVSACSSSQTNSESDETAPLLEADSSADQVGSIPEDMLASEEAATEPTASDPTATTEEPSAIGNLTEEQSTDPFKDLKESESSESLASTESEPSSTGETREYRVKAGDTLMKIAFTIYGDIDRWKDLQTWNSGSLKGSEQLRKGMKLKYEVPSESFNPEMLAHSYTIKKGDTLANIADEVYGRKMKYKKLQNYNRKLIKDPNRIFAGFTIYYDITQQEMAEADARRQQRASEGGGSYSVSNSNNDVPSSLIPPTTGDTGPAPIAVAPAPGADMAPIPPPPPLPNGLNAPTSAVGQPTASGQ